MHPPGIGTVGGGPDRRYSALPALSMFGGGSQASQMRHGSIAVHGTDPLLQLAAPGTSSFSEALSSGGGLTGAGAGLATGPGGMLGSGGIGSMGRIAQENKVSTGTSSA
eukprot:GSA25T00009202001.1